MIGQPVTCPKFIGRADELSALDDARRALRKSHGSVVLVGGDAGIGKTRLVAEFLRRSTDVRGRSRATTDCLPNAQQPFGPVRAFVTTLLRDTPLDSLPPSVYRALVHLVPDDVPAAVRAATGSAELGKAELYSALVAFFKIVASKRLTLLTIEDLHWSDPSTLEFLTYLAPRIATTRLLVVATYRSDFLETSTPLRTSLAQMTREANVRDIRLEPLGVAETRALMDGALETHPKLSLEKRRDVEERAEGNPFFTEELLKSALAWRERKAELPLSIRATITERLAIVSEDDRAVLAHAAALGYRFDPDLLAIVARRSIDEVAHALRRARDLNVLVEEDGERVRYRFRHALTRQAIYDDALAFDRRRLHERILTVLESLDSNDRLEELAYHASAARIPEKVLTYNERAGDRAFALRALSEAATCFERALEVATADDDIARLRERIGNVLQQQGALRKAVDAFEAAYDLRMRRGEFDDAARLLTSAIGDRSNLGDERAVALAEPFIAEFGTRISAGERNRMIAMAARLASGGYDFVHASRLCAMLSDPRALAPRTRQNYLIAKLNESSAAEDRVAWQSVADDLLGIAYELPPVLAAVALVTAAQTGIYLGANDTVEAALDRADALLDDGPYAAVAAFAAAVRAVYLVTRGKMREAGAVFEASGDGPDSFVARLIAARAGPTYAIAAGDLALGERFFADDVLRSVREGEIVGESGLVLAARSLLLAAQGRIAEARSDARLALTNHPASLPQMGDVYVAAARVLDHSELDAVANAVRDWRELPPGMRRASAAHALATIAARREQNDAARAEADDAARSYRTLGWAYAEAQALELAGRLEEACSLYERCVAPGDLERFGVNRPAAVAIAPNGNLLLATILSAREREIAELVTEGFTNVAIGARLALAEKTVEKNLTTIFGKLGIRSRAQIAAFVARAQASASKS